MKKISIATMLCLLTTTLLSCHHEEPNSPEENLITAKPFTSNTQNHFEDYGILRYDLYHLYKNSNYNSNSLKDIANNVSDLMTYHSSLAPATIHLNNNFESQIDSLMTYPVEKLEEIFSENEISSLAKATIIEIMELFTDNTSMTKNEIYNNLVIIEASVISAQNLTNKDIDIILLCSSLFRYSLYDNGHDDDKDWDLSVGNFIVSLYGATISPQDALLLNLSSRILENKN